MAEDFSIDETIYGNISSIETTGFVDGPGVRVLVFMQGCPLRCAYCHNPENTFLKTKKTLMTPQQVVTKIKRYKSYFGKEGGVTFSGGEPLNQPRFLLEVLKLCKEEGINTAIDTSGCGDGNYEELLKYIDTVILDIKAIDKEDYKKLTGQDITHFNTFLKACQKNKNNLWLRQVIVPNINDTEENILKLKKYISKLTRVKKVELLPYHDMAKDKYKKLGLKYRLENTPAMDKKRCEQLQKLLRKKDKAKTDKAKKDLSKKKELSKDIKKDIKKQQKENKIKLKIALKEEKQKLKQQKLDKKNQNKACKNKRNNAC